MNMELPKRFQNSAIRINGNVLEIHHSISFEELMYELTYALKGQQCIYCGEKLNGKNRTLDHRYPRDTGGISITNNLFPCCSECNPHKGNLTHVEYLKMKKLPELEKKQYRKKIEKQKVKIMKEIGFILPKKWIIVINSNHVSYRDPKEVIRGKRYTKIREFYKKYGTLPRPIVVDRNNQLLDGYNILLFAKDFKIKVIPAVKLENVVKLCN